MHTENDSKDNKCNSKINDGNNECKDGKKMNNIIKYLKNRLVTLKDTLTTLSSKTYPSTVISTQPLVLKTCTDHSFKMNDRIIINGYIRCKILEVKHNILKCDSTDELIGTVKVCGEEYRRTKRIIGEIEWAIRRKEMTEWMCSDLISFSSRNNVYECAIDKNGDVICDDLSNLSIDTVKEMKTGLNDSQYRALLLSSSPLRILGPPGTGKTYTLVRIINRLIKDGKRVVVSTPSNMALDKIMDEYVSHYNDEYIRMGGKSKYMNVYDMDKKIRDKEKRNEKGNEKRNEKRNEKKNVRKDENKKNKNYRNKTKKNNDSRGKKNKKGKSINNDSYSKYSRNTNYDDETIITNYSLIFSTLHSLHRLKDTYDVVVVDECCQADTDELLLALMKGHSIVLSGDPYQLSYSGESTGIFSMISTPLVVLNVQYRMPHSLISFSNAYFYRNMLRSVQMENPFFFNTGNVLVIDTSEMNWQEHRGASIVNVEECKLVKSVLLYINDNHSTVKDVGVITPYRAQCTHIQSLVEDVPLTYHLKVSTVDGFQGQENDIIVLSLVRSNSESVIGFMDDIRRMNVALTRCKKGLIVIGDMAHYREYGRDSRNEMNVRMFYMSMCKWLEKEIVLDPAQFIELTRQS